MHYTLIQNGEEKTLPINHLGRIFFDIVGENVEIPAFLYDEEFSRVNTILEHMNPSERYVIELYYGVEDGKRLSFEELAGKIGFSTKEAGDMISSIRYSKIQCRDNRSYLKNGIKAAPIMKNTELFQAMELKKILLEEITNRAFGIFERTLYLDAILERCGVEIEPSDGYVSDKTDIEELDLSVRSYNCLKRARIKTLGTLRELKEEELLRIRNLGGKGCREVRSRMEELPKNPYATVKIKGPEGMVIYKFPAEPVEEKEIASWIYWSIVESRPESKTVLQRGMDARLVNLLLENGYFFIEDAEREKEQILLQLKEENLLNLKEEFLYYCELEQCEREKRKSGMVQLKYTPVPLPEFDDII